MSSSQSPAPKLSDQQARDTIQNDITDTLFVEAGAGTGKTTALVGRIISLIDAGISIQNIAAITFTEKAASELQSRIRQKLQERIQQQQSLSNTLATNIPNSEQDSGPEPTQRQLSSTLATNIPNSLKNSQQNHNHPSTQKDRFETALSELDGAPICTLHSFAQRILLEHALDASLPLKFNCFDEIEAEIMFQQEWENFQVNQLRCPQHALVFQLASALGINQQSLKSVARQFRDNWDLIRVYKGQKTSSVTTSLPKISELVKIKDNLLQTRQAYEQDFIPEEQGKNSKKRYKKCLELISALEALIDQPVDTTQFAKQLSEFISNYKVTDKDSLPKTLDRLQPSEKNLWLAIINEVPMKVADYLQKYLEPIFDYLAIVIARFTLDNAGERKKTGQLIFHDLLVYCLELLKDPQNGITIRSSLGNRYQRILIDEFQDTDPIQIELVSLIASRPSKSNSIKTPIGYDWQNLPIEGGNLFFVGDPKQSIYRFRRANISLYLQAAGHYGPTLDLQTNWRSTKPILNWVNQVFNKLIKQQPGSQAQYMPLYGIHEQPKGDPGPPVAILGSTPLAGTSSQDKSEKLSAEELRDIEAEEVAKLIRIIIENGWLVSQKKSGHDKETHRKAELSDICLLSASRNNFDNLEDALSKYKIPYQVQVSNNIFASPEIRDLVALLKSVEDPTDEYNIVTALRSVAFGCGDDDLYAFFRLGGRWDYRENLPTEISVNHPVAEALTWLNEAHQLSSVLSPSQTTEYIIRQRNLFELALVNNNYRDIWRRLGFILDLARKFSEKEADTLRQFINYLHYLGENTVKLKEEIVPESDFDAVKIMTIHAAKGLEFPIVILTDSASKLDRRQENSEIIWNDKNQMGFYLKTNHLTKVYEDFKDEHQLREYHEVIRKLYVACTRACDHLVVCLHRKGKETSSEDSGKHQPSQKANGEPKLQGELFASVLPAYETVTLSSYSQTTDKPCWEPDKSPYVAFDLTDLPDAEAVSNLVPLDLPGAANPEMSSGHLSNFVEWQLQIETIQAASQLQRVWSASRISQAHKPEKSAREIADSKTEIATNTHTTSSSNASAREIVDPATEIATVENGFEPEPDVNAETKDVDWQAPRDSSIGRSATNVGSAVHAVLQTFDLRSLADSGWEEISEALFSLANVQAEAFGIHSRAGKNEIRQLAEQALKADCMQVASRAKSIKKEFYLSAALEFSQPANKPAQQRLLDGCIDLAYLDAAEDFVIVDYKTDNSKSKDLFDAKLQQYKLQMASYALATEKTTGKKVSNCVLLFIPRKGSSFMQAVREEIIEGEELSALKAEVEKFLSQTSTTKP